MRTLRRLIRIPVLFVHVVVGVTAIVWATGWDRLRGNRLHQGLARRMQIFWSRSICRILGVRLHVHGETMAEPPALVVSNHLSWLDILVITAYWPVSFLSKSEVRSWPGIGSAATALGTLYIDRGARNASAQANEVMARRLREGHNVVLFPEGTTSYGRELLPFRPRLFQAALDAGVPIQPVTLLYLDASGEPSVHAPFINEEKLVSHVMRLAGEPRTDCHVHVCPMIPVEGQRRRDLAAASRAVMARALELPEAGGADASGGQGNGEGERLRA